MTSDVASDAFIGDASGVQPDAATSIVSDVDKAQSMADVLKALNDTIAQQQAQINQLLIHTVESLPEVDSDFTVLTKRRLPEQDESLKKRAKDGTDQEFVKLSATALRNRRRKYHKHIKINKPSLPEVDWSSIKIKVKDGSEECSLDKAEGIRLIREDAYFKAKFIMMNCLDTLYHAKVIDTDVTITCSKVGVEEENTFRSADMELPLLRDYDLFARYHPHDALEDFQGDSLLNARGAEMEALFDKLRMRSSLNGSFICCSPRKGFISFYAQCLTEPGSTLLSIEHHITLPIALLFDYLPSNKKSKYPQYINVLQSRLKQAVDPSIKGIKLLDNILLENRGGILLGKVGYKSRNLERRSDEVSVITFSDYNPACLTPIGSRWKRMKLMEYYFNDSVEAYKKKLDLQAKEWEDVDTSDVIGHDQGDEVVDACGEGKETKPSDELNNDFIPFNP